MLAEIAQWTGLTDDERARIMADLPGRAALLDADPAVAPEHA